MDYRTIYQDLAAFSAAKVKTPLLVWHESPTESEILLIAAQDNISKINTSKGGNFFTLLAKISAITGQKDSLLAAIEGDELSYPIEPIELLEAELNWQPLINLIEQARALEPEYADSLSPELIAELKNNFSQDVTAAAVDAAFHSIILYLAAQANSLGITSVGVSGELALNDRFRYLIAKHLSDTFEIRFTGNSEVSL